MAESIERLSFELTQKALAEQERALAGLRTCASIVLAAASITGSFLGAKIGHGSLDATGIAAMISFGLCLASSIWVLLPHSFVLCFPGEALLAMSAQGRLGGVMGAYRAVSVWVNPYLRANNEKIAGLSSWLTVSCVLLTAEVLLWIISFVG
jgi:hypothetical protein